MVKVIRKKPETCEEKSPWLPGNPAAPGSPIRPAGPVGPLAPVALVEPGYPTRPENPGLPVAPVKPVRPLKPRGPVKPASQMFQFYWNYNAQNMHSVRPTLIPPEARRDTGSHFVMFRPNVKNSIHVLTCINMLPISMFCLNI